MKWFVALNQSSANYGPIGNMVKVAVHTAALHTSLVPHFLFDGQEDSLTDWLRQRGVTIVPCRSALHDRLAELAAARGAPHVLTVGAGAFLRTEIPRVIARMGWSDKYVLYTDCDVMFMTEVADYFSRLTPRTFTVGPEMNPNDYLHMNTGVMLMNVPQLASDLATFDSFMLKHLDACTRGSWDQSAYMWFYNPMIRLMLASGVSMSLANRIFNRLARYKVSMRPRWDKLPPEYNWKPYWSLDYSAAKIVHFHGPKAHEREMLLSPNPPANLKHLAADVRGGYLALSDLWQEHLAAANESLLLTSSAA